MLTRYRGRPESMLTRYRGRPERPEREGGGETVAAEADAVAVLCDVEREGADYAVRRRLAWHPLPARVSAEGERDRVAAHAVHGDEDARSLHQRAAAHASAHDHRIRAVLLSLLIRHADHLTATPDQQALGPAVVEPVAALVLFTHFRDFTAERPTIPNPVPFDVSGTRDPGT
eukprot:3491447-Rhodomonas_salina.1